MKAAKNPPVYMHIARYICCCIAAAYAADRRRKYKKNETKRGEEKKMEKQRKIGSLFCKGSAGLAESIPSPFAEQPRLLVGAFFGQTFLALIINPKSVKRAQTSTGKGREGFGVAGRKPSLRHALEIVFECLVRSWLASSASYPVEGSSS